MRAAGLDASARQYHLYRDMRTYGKYETLYTRSRELGSVYLRFPDDYPLWRNTLATSADKDILVPPFVHLLSPLLPNDLTTLFP